jgi:hypothetical protein
MKYLWAAGTLVVALVWLVVSVSQPSIPPAAGQRAGSATLSTSAKFPSTPVAQEGGARPQEPAPTLDDQGPVVRGNSPIGERLRAPVGADDGSVPSAPPLNPAEAIAMTADEMDAIMATITNELLARQADIRGRYARGDISYEEKKSLERTLYVEMDKRAEDILGQERAAIVADLGPAWAAEQLPALAAAMTALGRHGDAPRAADAAPAE